MRNPRILTFLHSFEPGGVERAALRLAAEWRAAGYDAPVLLGRDDGARHGDAPPLDYIAPPGGARWTARFETLWMIGRLRREILRAPPDILFCAGNSYAVVAVAMKLLLRRRCPPILAKISNDLGRRDMPLPIRAAYRRWLRIQGLAIDHFVGMAEPMRAEIASAMRVPPRRISIIDNPALDAARFDTLRAAGAARSRGGTGRRFLAVGRLVRQKNFAMLLRAFAAGAGPEDRLTILGEGPERRRLTRLAHRLGLAGRVVMPGHEADIARWAGTSDILLLSSDYEGVPAVVIEALAAGLAIVATDCSAAMADLLDHGRLGRLVQVGDSERFAEGIAAACACDVDAAAAGRQAARFHVATAAPLYIALLQRLVARAPSGMRNRNAAVVLPSE